MWGEYHFACVWMYQRSIPVLVNYALYQTPQANQMDTIILPLNVQFYWQIIEDVWAVSLDISRLPNDWGLRCLQACSLGSPMGCWLWLRSSIWIQSQAEACGISDLPWCPHPITCIGQESGSKEAHIPALLFLCSSLGWIPIPPHELCPQVKFCVYFSHVWNKGSFWKDAKMPHTHWMPQNHIRYYSGECMQLRLW